MSNIIESNVLDDYIHGKSNFINIITELSLIIKLIFIKLISVNEPFDKVLFKFNSI